jgi:hypothetical protein
MARRSKADVLAPSAMATVADRRFADAEALVATGSNARANGAIYMSGIVLDILLKAQLVRRYPGVAGARPHDLGRLAPEDREVWHLVWRSHEIEQMFDRLPHLEAALTARGVRNGTDYAVRLKQLCAMWSIQIRYSAQTALISEAREFLDGVRTLKELLK